MMTENAIHYKFCDILSRLHRIFDYTNNYSSNRKAWIYTVYSTYSFENTFSFINGMCGRPPTFGPRPFKQLTNRVSHLKNPSLLCSGCSGKFAKLYSTVLDRKDSYNEQDVLFNGPCTPKFI